ncbi:MAG TPA: sigma-70 family RNA polymerase sigma factor [Candidatus Angelobacter sp.]|nr:sigma-70 family RNA polymerase sigma factor [Candidatus Angelobacter sp.]
MDPISGEVTRLLVDLRTGSKDAESKLLVLLYDELRRLAAGYLRRERPDHTLQPTALINEAYLRIVDQPQQNWENRAHFLGVCAHIMRQILVDHARKRDAGKRGGRLKPLPLDESALFAAHRRPELVALDEALSRLEAFDSRQGRVVELRFFGGMSEEEISHVLGVSVRTIKRDWNVARAWLYSEMTK